VEVALPLRGWVVEGKQLAAHAFAGTVRRLGPRALDAALEVALAPLTNVKLRLGDPAQGRESGDLYGKVVGVAPEGAGAVTRIRLTSVDAADQKIIEMLLVR
jgi:hypothetical protein